MTETMANGYLSGTTQWELSNEYQYDGLDGFQTFLGSRALDECYLSIGRVKCPEIQWCISMLLCTYVKAVVIADMQENKKKNFPKKTKKTFKPSNAEATLDY